MPREVYPSIKYRGDKYFSNENYIPENVPGGNSLQQKIQSNAQIAFHIFNISVNDNGVLDEFMDHESIENSSHALDEVVNGGKTNDWILGTRSRIGK